MNIEFIKSEFEKLSLIIRPWRDGEDISAIERDIALDRLKTIYDALRFGTPARQPEANGPEAAMPSPAGRPGESAPEQDAAPEEGCAPEPDTADDQPQDDVEVEFIFAEDEEPYGEEEAAGHEAICADAAPEPAPAEPETTVTETAATETAATAEPETEPAAKDAGESETAGRPAEEQVSAEPAATEEGDDDTAAGQTAEDPAPEPAAEQPAEEHQAAPVAEDDIPAERKQEPAPSVSDEQPATAPEIHDGRRTEAANREQRAENRPGDAPAPQPARRPMSSLFGADEIHSRPRTKHHRMMSIYNDAQPRPEKVVDISKIFDMDMDEPATELHAGTRTGIAGAPRAEQRPTTAPQPAPEPVFGTKPAGTVNDLRPDDQQQNATIGDTIGANTQTLADTLGKPAALAEEITHKRIGSLRQAIGINDKFLMIRDLFDGDGEAYDEAIRTLDGFDSLDDCMIHIVENYAWNPNSEGAKFIMQLLERKLS